MNKNQQYYTIGLMSGSSLDGLDIAYCQFTFNEKWEYSLLKSKTAPLGVWEQQLRNAIHISEESLIQLSIEFAKYLAQEVQFFIQENQITEIDAVISHGHTIYHYPEKRITCQIGDGQTLANLLEIKVINNLRQKDMDAGGQGAPIVPIGDLHLYADFPICLNIGGIANLSIQLKNTIIAFDVCTANQVLNHYANKLGLDYDDKGRLARKGTINTKLLNELNSLDFYNKNYPKSLDNSFRIEIIDLIDIEEKNIENILATYTEHIAFQIKSSLEKNNISESKMLVSGGGAFNEFLIERIKVHSKCVVIEIPTQEIINYKEAIVMAFIGVLKLRNEVNVLASATGAKIDTVCGDVFINS